MNLEIAEFCHADFFYPFQLVDSMLRYAINFIDATAHRKITKSPMGRK